MANRGIMPMEGIKVGRDMENNAKWRKENIRRIVVNVNKQTQSDVLEHLDKQPSRQSYIINLIRDDMKKGR